MSLEKKIWELSEQYLENNSQYVVDVAISKGGKKKVVIFIDADKGVGVKIEDCSSLSRKLSAYLETEELIEGAYVLEVSSAGMANPFKIKRQYQKNIGRQVQLILKDGKDLQGVLSDLTEDNITLDIKKGKKDLQKESISFEDIKQTKLIITI